MAHNAICWRRWNDSSYEPVPTIIEAATTIFAGHNVQEISRADAHNLSICSDEVIKIIHDTRIKRKKRIIVITGVPGAGKTLAGLNVVHQAKDENDEEERIVYLSGNTPLVLVIREALAQDEKNRAERDGNKRSMKEIRHDLQSRIQHINDFLKEYFGHDIQNPPYEHAIVFDEAQRAWNHAQGREKFNRNASEPELLMEIMGRHKDWAAIICLVGTGQEINSGEPGMQQWGEAVVNNPEWEIVAADDAMYGSEDTAGMALFPQGVPPSTVFHTNKELQLRIPMRSYRSEKVSRWVDAVIDNRPEDAYLLSKELGEFPITLVRSISECRKILKGTSKN